MSTPWNPGPSIEEACREYLSKRPSTLWGRAYNVQDENGLEAAVEWLTTQVRNVLVTSAVQASQAVE